MDNYEVVKWVLILSVIITIAVLVVIITYPQDGKSITVRAQDYGEQHGFTDVNCDFDYGCTGWKGDMHYQLYTGVRM